MCTCYRVPAGNEPVRYKPPPLEPDADELDHYKTQVKIMTDLLNVSLKPDLLYTVGLLLSWIKRVSVLV